MKYRHLESFGVFGHIGAMVWSSCVTSIFVDATMLLIPIILLRKHWPRSSFADCQQLLHSKHTVICRHESIVKGAHRISQRHRGRSSCSLCPAHQQIVVSILIVSDALSGPQGDYSPSLATSWMTARTSCIIIG